MQLFTNKDKKYKIILFLKSINCCKKKNIYIYIYIYLFLQTKTYFCYIAFEMSHTIVFLIFGVLNIKYLPFKTPNTSTLILG